MKNLTLTQDQATFNLPMMFQHARISANGEISKKLKVFVQTFRPGLTAKHLIFVAGIARIQNIGRRHNGSNLIASITLIKDIVLRDNPLQVLRSGLVPKTSIQNTTVAIVERTCQLFMKNRQKTTKSAHI